MRRAHVVASEDCVLADVVERLGRHRPDGDVLRGLWHEEQRRADAAERCVGQLTDRLFYSAMRIAELLAELPEAMRDAVQLSQIRGVLGHMCAGLAPIVAPAGGARGAERGARARAGPPRRGRARAGDRAAPHRARRGCRRRGGVAVTCSECDGKGKKVIACEGCDGECSCVMCGRDCEECDGEGTVECECCDGTGEEPGEDDEDAPDAECEEAH